MGDQSSGKSSLLENLTGIPFPRNLELCTRYATQITSRRDRVPKVNVTIIPGPNASDQLKARLRKYHPPGMSPDDFREKFPEILEEVCFQMTAVLFGRCLFADFELQVNKTMGIRMETSDTGGSVFSEDVLKIEISGPGQDYLTLIDVPGIFRTPTEGLTTKEDVALVRRMVQGYIKDRRTIILAVLPSNVDPATQEILTMAEEYDKQGERTLGVLTKPDLVTEDSAKLAVCNVVLGKKRPLALGYYVARNRGPDENDKFDKGSAEGMFSENPWNSLPKDRVGVRALRTRLGQLLGQITKQEFPAMRKDIQQQLAQCSQELDSLGAPRQSEHEQRAFLFSLSRQFHDLVQNALDTRYNRHPAFSQQKLRLATNVANVSDTFNNDFAARSHLYYFENEEPILEKEVPEKEPDDQSDDAQSDDSQNNDSQNDKELDDSLKVNADQEQSDGGWHDSDAKELLRDGIIRKKPCIELPKMGIMNWIRNLHLQCRGLGLGTFDNALLSNVFREQSEKWSDMTMAYLSETIVMIHRFIYGALFELCANARVRENIWSAIADEVAKRYKVAMEQAAFIVSIERNQTPYTLNHYFNKNLQKSRGDRMAKLLEGKVRYESVYEKNHVRNTTPLIVNLEDVKTATINKSNMQQSIEDVHDSLRAFYKVARKRFVDTVYQQLVQGLLLTGPKSPLSVFDQDWVLSLDAGELDMIAGELPTVKEQRTLLQKKIKDLEVAMQILKK